MGYIPTIPDGSFGIKKAARRQQACGNEGNMHLTDIKELYREQEKYAGAEVTIGGWIRRQRLLRRGSRSDGRDGSNGEKGGTGVGLTKEQIARLDSIGMVWKTKPEQKWDQGYAEARAYYEANGNLNVPASYVSPTGYKLGGWIVDQREKGKEKCKPERREKLEEIGMVWVKPDPWEIRYQLAKAYYEEYGNLKIPLKYRADGVWLAKWVNEQKHIYAGNRGEKTLRADQVRRLEMIGMEWVK